MSYNAKLGISRFFFYCSLIIVALQKLKINREKNFITPYRCYSITIMYK